MTTKNITTLTVAAMFAASCGSMTDTSGGDFGKGTITEIAEGYREEAEAPKTVEGGAAALRTQAQSTTYLAMTLADEFIGTGTDLTVENKTQAGTVLTTTIADVDDAGFDLIEGSDGIWTLRVFPGNASVMETLAVGANALTAIVNEPQVADSNEPITVTRTAAFDVVVEDFVLLQPGLTAFAGNNPESADGGLQAWGSIYAAPTAKTSKTEFINADFAAILFEPNE